MKGAMQAGDGESVNSVACLEAVLRQLDEGRQSIGVLQFQTEHFQASLMAAEKTQQATMQELRLLRGQIDRLGEAGAAPAEDPLDFGAPIGKTWNTQDMASMHAETRADLEELRRRI